MVKQGLSRGVARGVSHGKDRPVSGSLWPGEHEILLKLRDLRLPDQLPVPFVQTPARSEKPRTSTKALARSSTPAIARGAWAPRPRASRTATVLAKTARAAKSPVVKAVPSAMANAAAMPAGKRPCESA